jgi:proteasome lid subunit RPN8/RPN11
MTNETGPSPSGAVIEFYLGDPPQLRYRAGLAQVLATALRSVVPDVIRTAGMRVEARVLEVMDGDGAASFPNLTNLAPRLGCIEITGRRDGAVVWQGRFQVSELLGEVLPRLVEELEPGQTGWAFRIAARPGLPLPAAPAAARPARPRLNLAIRPEAEPPEPVVDPAGLGLRAPPRGEIAVVYSAAAHDVLTRTMSFSEHHEDGGFLEGSVSKSGTDGGHIVRVEKVHPAEHGRSSAVDFIFTSESFSVISERLASGGGQLVGWYHTHLFPAGGMGLSATDVDTHLTTFQRSWQVAALVNVTRAGRTLRTYARSGDTMQECDQWISDERGGHRRAGT